MALSRGGYPAQQRIAIPVLLAPIQPGQQTKHPETQLKATRHTRSSGPVLRAELGRRKHKRVVSARLALILFL